MALGTKTLTSPPLLHRRDLWFSLPNFDFFEKELNERLMVSENGRRRTITKREAMVEHLVNKAVSGDKKLKQLLLEEIRLIEAKTSAPTSDNAIFDEADRQVILRLQERIRRLVKTEGGNDETDQG
jgi:hypothetical protein